MTNASKDKEIVNTIIFIVIALIFSLVVIPLIIQKITQASENSLKKNQETTNLWKWVTCFENNPSSPEPTMMG